MIDPAVTLVPCSFDSASTGSGSSSSNYCDQLCTNVSIVSDLVECASRRGAGDIVGVAGGRAADSLLHAVAGFGDTSSIGGHNDDISDSDRSSLAHIEREYYRITFSSNSPKCCPVYFLLQNRYGHAVEMFI
jgi:hypothetical protein